MKRNESTQALASVAARRAFLALTNALGPAKQDWCDPVAVMAYQMVRQMLDETLVTVTKDAFDQGCLERPKETL